MYMPRLFWAEYGSVYYFHRIINPLGRGGCQMVSALAFNSDGPSLNPAEASKI